MQRDVKVLPDTWEVVGAGQRDGKKLPNVLLSELVHVFLLCNCKKIIKRMRGCLKFTRQLIDVLFVQTHRRFGVLV